MTTYEQIHILWITLWTLVAFSVLVVLAFGLVFWELAKLRRRIDYVERAKADKQLTLTITARDNASEALRRVRRYPEPPANT